MATLMAELKAEDITVDLQRRYAGKWIAIDKGQILAIGNSVSEVMAEVKKLNLSDLPEVTKVPRPGEEMCVL